MLDPMRVKRIAWGREEPPGEQDLRRQLEEEGFDVVTWRDRCNWSYAAHHHEHDESLWVLRGSIVLRIGGEDYSLGPGDRLMLPRETVHSAQVGPEGATYLIGQRF